MQTEKKSFIGIDVSKSWFDLSLLTTHNGVKQDMITEQFDNTSPGLKLLTKWLKAKGVSFDNNTLIVIENTGVYHRLIWE